MADNPLRQTIVDIVRGELNRYLEPQTATVLKYEKKENLAKIRVDDIKAGGIRVIEDVPVKISKGLIDYGINPGDRVMVEFHSGDPDAPYISMLMDEKYESNTRENNKAPEDVPKTGNTINGSKEYEDPESKRYMENGRMGIIHPQHKSTMRIDNESGDVDLIASKNLVEGEDDPQATSAFRVRSDGNIESIAGRVDNYSAEYNINTDKNGFYYNNYPLNQKMAAMNQGLMSGGTTRAKESIMATKEDIKRLMGAIQTLPGAQGVRLKGAKTYGDKRSNIMTDYAERAHDIVSEYFPEL
jgi:hypothetical protein